MMTLRTTAFALTLTAALFATSAAHGAAIAHWSFDETSGTTITDDVGGNTATQVAGTVNLNVAGQFGTGVDMTGDAWYNVNAFSGFQSNSMTFAAWVKVDQLEGNNQEVFGKWYSQHHFRFEVRGGTNLRNSSDVDIVQGTTNVPDLLWHHVAWVSPHRVRGVRRRVVGLDRRDAGGRQRAQRLDDRSALVPHRLRWHGHRR